MRLHLIEIRSKNKWHSYLTSVTNPEILPPHVVANLYGKRWRIEEAFNQQFSLWKLYPNYCSKIKMKTSEKAIASLEIFVIEQMY